MNPIMSITKRQARKFLLKKQLLLDPRKKLTGLPGIDSVFRKLGAIQIDPLNPCGNNVDLVLQSRIKNIRVSDYHTWAYDNRQGIEIFQKELCIVPLDKIELARRYYTKSRINRLNSFYEKYETDLQTLMHFIKTAGPISSKQIKDDRSLTSAWGSNSTWGSAALNVLCLMGGLCVVGRDKNRKIYDLAKRAYGISIQNKYPIKLNGLNLNQVLGRVDSVGLLPSSGTGQGWLGVGLGREIKPVLENLAKKNKIRRVQIEGVRTEYVIQTRDLEILDSTKNKRNSGQISFIAPLDNLMWDRKMISEIFDFEYRWEVYTPAHKRQYGYYVLPVLFGDKFIGRIEPILNSKKNLLEIKGFWLEPDITWSDELQSKFNVYLKHFLKYLNAQDIVFKSGLWHA